MKLNTILKALPLAIGLGFCSTANAGVVATAYLELNNFFVELDVDGDQQADQVNVLDYITINSATRTSASSATYNGVSSGDTSVDGSGVGTSDALLVCNGPSCGGLGLSNNGQSADLANLVQDDSERYAVSDSRVTGSALGSGASGFTYGDVGISHGHNVSASAQSRIFNNLQTTLSLAVGSSLNLRFSAIYDAIVDSVISADIANDTNRAATASAIASFSVRIVQANFNDGFFLADFATDAPGQGDEVQIAMNDASFLSSWVNLSAGDYQVIISQDSDVAASLVPEPAAAVLFGMGLLGLGL
eukprot:CAMPEP_0182881080 /NCGR_PEP_ID=MMETSP0034_2-20130328/16962_1 /TAXON_ID=156128 /ORGANISM="Nephroselmis pyriformis, Strain CCMP717" /LENGTH=302 /DNA_ID=CAMNT_0025014099 /DNA_START=77 /DNA_END=982 /DNA_ORIENTATION=-